MLIWPHLTRLLPGLACVQHTSQLYIYCAYRSVEAHRGNTFPLMKSIHSKKSNFPEDAVNNIDPPTTNLFQGVPTHRIISKQN